MSNNIEEKVVVITLEFQALRNDFSDSFCQASFRQESRMIRLEL